MGKENELLKAVESNNIGKVKKLLNSVNKKSKLVEALSGHSIRKFRSTPDLLYTSNPNISNGNLNGQANGDEQHLQSINLQYRHPTKGTTPLLLAVLHGFYAIVDLLLLHGADANVRDEKGNTALHLAVFNGRSDIMDLLLKFKVKINVCNDDGNTALHIAAQQCGLGKKHIVHKLLNCGARLTIPNHSGHTPSDLACIYDRPDALSLMLECDCQLVRRSDLALVEASVRGHTHIVKMLVQANCPVNQLNYKRGTRPLHEAVRFLRVSTVRVLLEGGADINLKNSRGETVESILAGGYGAEKGDEVRRLIQEVSVKKKALNEEGKVDVDSCEEYLNAVPDSTPLLVGNARWTMNNSLYCSSCTSLGSNTNVLDGNPHSFWTIPDVRNMWLILDLGDDHIITGVDITGWAHINMIRECQLQASHSLYGPWQNIHKFTCSKLGSVDPLKPGVAQSFSGFKHASRWWRLFIHTNHGGECTSFQGVALHGLNRMLWRFYVSQDLYKYADQLVAGIGANTLTHITRVTEEDIDGMSYESEGEHLRVKHILMDKKLESYSSLEMKWLIPPVSSVIAGKPLPEFSVQAPPLLFEELDVVSFTSKLSGNTRTKLVPQGSNKPSIATFTGVIMNQCGNYLLEVRSVRFPWLSLRTKRQTRVVEENVFKPVISTSIHGDMSF